MTSILKVDQLQDSGGNALITSDGAGNLTSGTIPAKTIGTGAVLQVVNGLGSAITVNTTTPTAVSSVSITTSSTSSKIFVIFSGNGNPNQVGGWQNMQVYRGSTGVGRRIVFENGGASSNNVPFALQALDTPSTTSSVTYEARAWQGSGSWTYGEGGDLYATTITAFEIAG